jgi:hypothetical protein
MLKKTVLKDDLLTITFNQALFVLEILAKKKYFLVMRF